MMDFVSARERMVDSQLRPNAVTDPRVIVAMLEVEREKFVPASQRALAYLDEDTVIKDSTDGSPARFIVEPMVFARMLQLAEIEGDDLVLDIGVASGYSSAVISRLASAVVAIENDEDLAGRASELLVEQGIDTVAVFHSELTDGYADQGPYDVILIEGAVDRIPDDLFDQLRDGGRLVAVVKQGAIGRAMLYRKNGDDIGAMAGFDANTLPLDGFQRAEEFTF